MASSGFNLKTERMLLRELEPADAKPLFHLNSNRDVMRYTGQTSFADVAAARQFIKRYSHYRDHGFGRWAVEALSDGDFMGFCGLQRREAGGDVDLAFRFFPHYWAAGFATEAASACVTAGFEQFGLERILGYALRENLPSISVLQKLGMTFHQTTEEDGVFWLVYRLDRPA